MEELILGINILSTFFMLGVIWVVQMVHYPLFAQVGEDFQKYHKNHVRLITGVVAIPMILEALTSILMLWYPYPGVPMPLLWLSVALIFVIWFTTLFCSVPFHDQLKQGFDVTKHQKLLYSNWIRVLSWSFRAIIMGHILFNMIT